MSVRLFSLCIGVFILLGIAHAEYDNSLSTLSDAAGMFNERGYQKSNAYSYDGGEIINDFNGNLMFKKTLEYIPMSQDGINFDLTLTYNGSVGHIAQSGTKPSVFKKNAINLPEWIFSVNNLAIQVLNFENELISWGPNHIDSVAANDGVAALVNGYHYNYSRVLTDGTDTTHGNMSFLLGDGSIQSFVSLENGDNSTTNPSGKLEEMYLGEYVTYSKDDRSRGFLDSHGVFTMFRDDGTKIVFRLCRTHWRTEVPDAFYFIYDTLKIFLPQIISDNLGNSIWIHYSDEYYDWQTGEPWYTCCDTIIYGRPFVVAMDVIGPDIEYDFHWNPTASEIEVDITRDDEKRYNIFFSDGQGGGEKPNSCGDVNRGHVTYIKDPEGRITNFEYKNYKRSMVKVASSRPQYTKGIQCEDTLATSLFPPTVYDLTLFRLSEISYPDGGKSYFSYYNDDMTAWPSGGPIDDSLGVDCDTYCPAGRTPCVQSEEFVNLGRDPFYTNMVTAARRFEIHGNDTTVISIDSLEFSWYDAPDTIEVGYISPSDVFYTDRYFINPEESDCDFEEKEQNFTYKQYPEMGPYSTDSRDRGWVLKLTNLHEGDPWDEHTVTTSNIWDTDSSTFQLLSQTVNRDGMVGTTTYEYVWDSIATDRRYNNLLKTTTTDPWGTVTETYYTQAFIDHNPEDWFSLYSNTLVDSTLTKVNIDSYLITIGKLYNEYYPEFESIDSELVTGGRRGQLKSTMSYDITIDSSNHTSTCVDTVTKSYTYGAFGGLLSRETDPRGNFVDYFYGSVERQARQLNSDGTLEEFSKRFDNSIPFWTQMDLTKVDTTYGWRYIARIDTNLSYVLATSHDGAIIRPKDDTTEFSVQIPNSAIMTCDQTISYTLTTSDCYWLISKSWISVNGVPVDSITCDDDASRKYGTLAVEEDDIVSVYSYSKAREILETSGFKARSLAAFSYLDCDNVNIDTVGIPVKDYLSQYREVDKQGNLVASSHPSMSYSTVSYDALNRIEEAILPGSFMPTGWEVPTIPENDDTSLVFMATFDGVHSNDLNNMISYCDDTALTCVRVEYSHSDDRSGTSKSFWYYTLDRSQSPLFRFDSLDLSPVTYYDSARLVLYCLSGSDGIKVNHYKNKWIDNCGDSTYYVAWSDDYRRTVSPGVVSFYVNGHIRDWLNDTDSNEVYALSLSKCESTIDDSPTKELIFASSEHPDPNKRPRLIIYYHTNPGSEVEDYQFHTLNFEYDDSYTDGDEVSVTTEITNDLLGFPQTTESFFDGFGRASKTYHFDSTSSKDSTMAEYNFSDRVINQIDQLGNATSTCYDALGRAVMVNPPDTGTLEYDYTADDTTGLGFPSSFNFKHAGLLRTESTDENENVVEEYTDIRGNLRLKRSFPDGATTLSTYFDYDDWGNLTTVIKPKGDSVNYRYNSLGWLMKEWASDYDTIFYRYDKNGNLTQRRDAQIAAYDTTQNSSVKIDTIYRYKGYSSGSNRDTIFCKERGYVSYYLETVDDGGGGQLPWRTAISMISLNGATMARAIFCDSCTAMGSFEVLAGDTVSTYTMSPYQDQDGHALADVDYFLYSYDSTWQENSYDALNRLTQTGIRKYIKYSYPDSSDWGHDTTYVPVAASFYDQFNAELSQGRLSMTYNYEADYSERFDYDDRGRIRRQKNYYAADLDSTQNDSTWIEKTLSHGVDTVLFEVLKSDTFYIYMQSDRCYNQDSSFIELYKNDSLIKHLSSADTGVNFVSYWDTIYIDLEGTRDTLMWIASIGPGVDTIASYLYGSAGYNAYFGKYQYYASTYENDTYEIEYTYDNADRIKSIKYPHHSYLTVYYDYDKRGRLDNVLAVTDSVGVVDSMPIAKFYYTARDEISAMVLGDSLQVVDYAYSDRGWLQTINDGTSNDTSGLFGEKLYYYSHPSATAQLNGNIIAQKLAYDGVDSMEYAYAYDDINRLTEVKIDTTASGLNTHENFAYDDNGNFEHRVLNQSDTTYYNYQSGTNLLTSVSGAKTDQYIYNGFGALSVDTAKNAYYHYDIIGRLDSIRFPNATGDTYLAFAYNAAGERVGKYFNYYYKDSCVGGGGQESAVFGGGGVELSEASLSGGEVLLLEGGDTLCTFHEVTKKRYIRSMGKVLAEYEDDGFYRKYSFIYAGDQRIAMLDQYNHLHFYLNDHLGSARLVIDSAGTIVDNYTKYFAYGAPEKEVVSSDQQYKYTGKPYDSDGGINLYYYGARYYDPELGRFISPDPLRGKYAAWGPHVYTLDNPMRFVDPDGKCAGVATVGGAVLVVATGAAIAAAYAYYTNPDVRAQTNSLAEHVSNEVGDAIDDLIEFASRVKDKIKNRLKPPPPRSEKERSEQSDKNRNKPAESQPKDSPTRPKEVPKNHPTQQDQLVPRKPPGSPFPKPIPIPLPLNDDDNDHLDETGNPN